MSDLRPVQTESLPTICFIPETVGQSCGMGKLIFDNRVIVSVFLVLAFLNALAIEHNWY